MSVHQGVKMQRTTLWMALMVVLALPGFSADWNPRHAADYLDSRQKEWFAWPRAQVEGGVCVSCHTGVTYLLARPMLRRSLGESQPTPYEKVLLEGIQAQAAAEGNRQGAEAVFAALVFSLQNAGSKTLSADSKRAFDRLWTLQIREGKERGAWKWPNANHDPWSTPDAPFYGASLAALVAGTAPAEYRRWADVRERTARLTDYFRRERARQPPRDSLALVWARPKLAAAMPAALRQNILKEILRAQQPDGGWTIASLGPWRPHPEAPPSEESNSYATGYVAFVLQQAGRTRSDPAVARAL